MNRSCMYIAALTISMTLTAGCRSSSHSPAVSSTVPEMQYTVRSAATPPNLTGDWEGPVWSQAETLELTHWYESPTHRPKVQARVLHDAQNIYVTFRVNDRYVRATREDYQASVCRDSCVEFFVRPKSNKGYFNFEMNCGGTLLLYYIEDPTFTPKGFRKFQEVPWELGKQIRVYHSLPKIVYPEIEEPTEWFVEYAIPLSLFEHYVGKLGALPGQEWKANFYKCADQTSQPHWVSWAPLSGPLNFHRPQDFQTIRFE